MQAFFYKLPKTIARCFSGSNLFWQMLAVVLTYILATSGFDWFYYTSLRNSFIYQLLFPAVILGSLLPITTMFTLYIVGILRKNVRTINAAYAVTQAGAVGLFISSFYKFFTGRIQPPHLLSISSVDISKIFKFGLDQGGIFWGWPSSHTTTAFACAIALFILYRESKLIKSLALTYAVYIGLGVSISIHWFSDFVGGVIVGTIVGVAVGESFLERYKSLQK